MERRFFPRVGLSEQEHAGFVEESESCEIAGVLACGFVDEVDLFAQGAGAEEEDHDQGVGKAHFGAVDCAITDGFDEGERCFVLGVEDDGFKGGLGEVSLV